MAVEDLLRQKLELADLLIEGGVPSDLKVVHLCSLDYGGAGKAAYRLHKGLQSIGIQSTMLVMERQVPQRQEEAPHPIDEDVERSGLGDPRALPDDDRDRDAAGQLHRGEQPRVVANRLEPGVAVLRDQARGRGPRLSPS